MHYISYKSCNFNKTYFLYGLFYTHTNDTSRTDTINMTVPFLLLHIEYSIHV